MAYSPKYVSYLKVQTLDLDGILACCDLGVFALGLAFLLLGTLVALLAGFRRLDLEQGIVFCLELNFLLLQRGQDASTTSGEQWLFVLEN